MRYFSVGFLIPIIQPQLGEHILQDKPSVDIIVNADLPPLAGEMIGHILADYRGLPLMGQHGLRVEQDADGGGISQGPALAAGPGAVV